MKPEKMMDVIGQIDDALVEEFAQRRPPRFRVPWSLVATAACLCLVIASLVFLRSAGLLPVAPMPTDPTQITQPTETTQPTDTTQPTETTTPTQPPALPALEGLDRYNALFGERGTFYNLALASTYDSADEVGLLYFFYNGINGELEAASAEEETQLKELQRHDDNHILYRMAESKMDEVLLQYFGLTVDQMNERSYAFAGMEYLESTDYWYYYGGATLSVGGFTARSVTANPDGTLDVYYSVGLDTVATKVVTLLPYGEGYRILSNINLNRTPDDVSTDWIIEEDTSIRGEITFAVPFKGAQGMDAMITAFNEIYPNIEVELHTYYTAIDGSVSINTVLLAGEVDVVAGVGVTGNYMRWVNGLLYDLTDMVEQEGIDLAWQWGTDAYTYDNKVYSFPCGGKSHYIAINMDAWNAAGLGELPTSWTWEEYLEACRKMTRKDDTGKTVVYGGSDHHDLDSIMYTYGQVNGGDLFYDWDGTSSYDSPVLLTALEQKLRAELEDGIWYPTQAYRNDSVTSQQIFCQGDVASTVAFNITNFLSNQETYPDVNWVTGFAPYPTMEAGQVNYMSGVMPDIHAGINAYIEEEKMPAAWAFLKWFSTYGAKYLTVAGYQSTWRGTDNGELLPLIYGSEEEATKWVDVESFERVLGRGDLPACMETTIKSYSDVSYALTKPMIKAISGELSAQECLRQALEEAENAM